MPFERLGDLAEMIIAESASPALSAPSRTQVWPVVTIRASTFASGGVYRDSAGPAGLNLNAALNPRLAGTGHFSNGVLRALLYCHGLVVEDPIAAAAEMYLGTRGELRAVARLAVVAATTSVVEIAPLVDADVISTYFTTSEAQKPVRELGLRSPSAWPNRVLDIRPPMPGRRSKPAISTVPPRRCRNCGGGCAQATVHHLLS
ncbi:MAG TPA: hypothetical protein VFX16_12790 [Pseudonocardiaceae bacterium]|nr:hypothetical protein [Pseudonocardiaceae bacterium]